MPNLAKALFNWLKGFNQSPRASLDESAKIKKLEPTFKASLVQELTAVVDYQTRSAMKRVRIKDIATPKGFAQRHKSSPSLESYFQAKDQLTKVIQNDIETNSQTKDKARAFSKWVDVAKRLIELHNYEGSSLVVLALIEKDSDWQLRRNLSKDTRDTYDYLCNLIFPINNFKTLRDHIAASTSRRTLMPSMLVSRDMDKVNEVLGELQKKLPTVPSTKTDSRYQKTLAVYKATVSVYNETLEKKESILDEFLHAKRKILPKLEIYRPEAQQIFNSLIVPPIAPKSKVVKKAPEPTPTAPRRNSVAAQVQRPKIVAGEPQPEVIERGHVRVRSKSIGDEPSSKPIPKPTPAQTPIQPTSLFAQKGTPTVWKKIAEEATLSKVPKVTASSLAL